MLSASQGIWQRICHSLTFRFLINLKNSNVEHGYYKKKTTRVSPGCWAARVLNHSQEQAFSGAWDTWHWKKHTLLSACSRLACLWLLCQIATQDKDTDSAPVTQKLSVCGKYLSKHLPTAFHIDLAQTTHLLLCILLSMGTTWLWCNPVHLSCQ